MAHLIACIRSVDPAVLLGIVGCVAFLAYQLAQRPKAKAEHELYKKEYEAFHTAYKRDMLARCKKAAK